MEAPIYLEASGSIKSAFRLSASFLAFTLTLYVILDGFDWE